VTGPDGDDLRAVFRRVPAGVGVVTVDHDGERLGLTVSAIVSLSLDPPLVGVAVARKAAMHEILRGAGAFAVGFLAAGDEGARLAAHFARGVPPIAMWHRIALRPGRDGLPPQLATAAGWLDCRTIAEHAAGDHTLFVAEVTAADPGPAERALTWVDGRAE
jgi:flavin reductase (DIM6/NTAB) family NADH-FMN oxidoreductase RutF